MRGTLFLLLLAFPGCGRERVEPAANHEPSAVPVRVASVERTSDAPPQRVAGTVRPLEHAVVAARVPGSVRGADFAIGQKVSAGDLLLTIQAAELQARVDRARAALDLAERDARREAALFAQGASTGEDARTAEDRLRTAKAEFAEANTLLGYTRVTAPFAGNITRKLVFNGDFASAGAPLLELEAKDPMRAEIEVPDALPMLPLETRVRVEVDDQIITGRITEASSAVHPVTRTRSVIVELPSGTAVQSGEFVRALWPAPEFPRLLVPIAAVSPFGQIERVFVVADDRAVLRIVRTGVRENERVQVLAGLDAGEQVITSPPASLRDGDPVRIAP